MRGTGEHDERLTSTEQGGTAHHDNSVVHGAAGQQQFTNQGPIPAVQPDGPAPGPSASDRAFGTLKVTASGLNVRSSPAKADNIIGGLQHSEQVQSTGEAGDWVSVSFRGVNAFVHGAFVEPVTGGSGPRVAADAHHVATELHGGGMNATPATGTLMVGPGQPQNAQPQTGHPYQHPQQNPNMPQAAQHTTTDKTYMQNYGHVVGEGTLADAPTTSDEVAILNAIRDDQKHRALDPTYLLKLQNALGVKDASGAMNTETLRKLQAHYHGTGTAVTAEAILKGDILTSIVAGTPTKDVGSGWGTHAHGSTGRVGRGASKADGMANAAGYANYAAMHDQMGEMKLLGVKFRNRAMPNLRARVALADDYLKARYQSEKDQSGKDWPAFAKDKFGIDGTNIVASYHDEAAKIERHGFEGGAALGPHMHSAGLALDIIPAENPYVFAGGTESPETDQIMAKHLKWAVQLFGGEEVTAKNMMAWSKESSTEELYARVRQASSSLSSYLKLAEEGSNADIEAAFCAAGFSETEAQANRVAVRHFGKKNFTEGGWSHGRFFQDNVSRDQANGLMTHKLDLVVALRDVAGLAWGGSEMSESYSGDFMHFDLRHDPMGKAVLDFSIANDVATEADVAAANAAQHHDNDRDPHRDH